MDWMFRLVPFERHAQFAVCSLNYLFNSPPPPELRIGPPRRHTPQPEGILAGPIHGCPCLLMAFVVKTRKKRTLSMPRDLNATCLSPNRIACVYTLKGMAPSEFVLFCFNYMFNSPHPSLPSGPQRQTSLWRPRQDLPCGVCAAAK